MHNLARTSHRTETVISVDALPTQAGQTEGDSSDPSSAEQPG